MRIFFACAIFLLTMGRCLADTSAAISTAPQGTPTPDPWKFCKDRFEVKYDKFKDETSIKPKSMRNGPRVKTKGGDDVIFWVTASYPGKQYDSQKPAKLSIVFFRLDVSQVKQEEIKEEHTGESKYKDCSTLILMADDEKMDFGTLKYDAKESFDSFTGFKYIDQTMTGPLTLEQLQKLANAKKIEGELCETTLEFQKDEYCDMHAILDFLK